MQKTVFILGAGSSQELDLPVGNALMSEIVRLLSADPRASQSTEDNQARLHQAIEALSDTAEKGGAMGYQNFRRAQDAILRGLDQSYSIDNFLDAHKNNEVIVQCGKLAIAAAILHSERKSNIIKPDKTPNGKTFSAGGVNGNWLNTFCKRLFMRTPFADLHRRLDEFQFINFNYDRCVEFYLLNAACAYYDKQPEEVMQAIAGLSIYHPYGTVGKLPGSMQRDPTGYGEVVSVKKLIEASSQIRTFTESVRSESPELLQAQTWVEDAERLIFLGFGFIPMNMELIFRAGVPPTKAQNFGTTYRVSESNTAFITKWFAERGLGKPLFADMPCEPFIAAHERALGLI